MDLHELSQRLRDHQDELWWSWRFLGELMKGAEASDDMADLGVACLVRLANADPDWIKSTLLTPSPESHGIAELLLGDRLQAAISSIQLPSRSDTALVRAQFFVAAAEWCQDENDEDLWQSAWDFLQMIPENERDRTWKQVALGPSARVAYPVYRELALEYLDGPVDAFYRSLFLPHALTAAATHRDWPMFEEWAGAFRKLPESLQRGHHLCAVINLEGMRALEEGRLDDAENLMRQLIEAAPEAQFLSNDDVSMFPRRLQADGLFPELCDKFDEIVKRRDWRTLGG